jgi:hypothetical protein
MGWVKGVSIARGETRAGRAEEGEEKMVSSLLLKNVRGVSILG